MTTDKTLVTTALGRLSGLQKKQVVEYRGIPYAQPPVGDKRFKRPQPSAPWQGVRRCDTYGAASLQENNALMGIASSDFDCLYLNMWVPEGEGPFPVMVWFHGGGYVWGSPSQMLYNGEALAAQQQVIVVNVGYRLGALGFGDFSPWLNESDTNLGLRDQLAALKWVNEHIAAFNGKPDDITIFGESAGGFSVACLLACPAAKGLFQRAVMQSGAGDMVVSPEESQRVTASLVDALGGAEQLYQADATSWVKAQRPSYKLSVKRGLRDNTPQFGMTWLPQIDGDLLPDIPVNAIAKGAAKDVTLLAGTCRDEWNLFQYALPFNGNKPLAKLADISEEKVRHNFHRALPLDKQAEQAFALYSHEPINEMRGKLDWYAALETHRLFTVPTQRVLDAQVAAGGKAYAYLFTHESNMMGVPLGACHVVDVPFVFDLIDKPIGQLFTGGGDVAKRLASQVQGVWGALARDEGLDVPAWQQGAAGRAIVFGPGESTQPLLSDKMLSFWQDVVPMPEST